jgi:hypothetical protein
MIIVAAIIIINNATTTTTNNNNKSSIMSIMYRIYTTGSVYKSENALGMSR